jgi:AcrR family transcriptional regulator
MKMPKKSFLTRSELVEAAMDLVNKEGLDGLSMRKLASKLHVEAMSLYHHVRNKAEILDALVDAVFQKIPWFPDELDWKTALRNRGQALRMTLKAHPWAIGLLDSRRDPGPATLAHHDAVLGVLRRGGFSVLMAAHAYSLMDSYIYGFVVQEQSLPAGSDVELQEVAAEMSRNFSRDAYPHLAELTFEHVMKPGYSFEREFSYGLEFILEGLERKLCSQT